MNFTNNLEEAEKVEKLRNKMLQYILYKKRSENEIRTKFSSEDENLVEDAIEYFADYGLLIKDVYEIIENVKSYIYHNKIKKLTKKQLKSIILNTIE